MWSTHSIDFYKDIEKEILFVFSMCKVRDQDRFTGKFTSKPFISLPKESGKKIPLQTHKSIVSFDQGETYQPYQYQLYFRYQFILSAKTVTVIERDKETITDILAYMGGLAGGIRILFTLSCRLVSLQVLESQLIRKLYFKQHSNFLSRRFNHISKNKFWFQ